MSSGRWRWMLVALWICGILFPFAALREYSSSYRQLFDAVFSYPAAHIAMHAFLFAALAAGLAGLMSWRAALVAVVLVAGLQETIQFLTGSEYDLADGMFDLGVDLAGAIVGLVVFRLARRARHRLESPA